MEFHSGDSSPPLTSIHAEQAGQDYGTLISEITELKKKIQAERICNVREKLVQNGKTLHSHIHNVLSTTSRLHSSAQENEERCVPYLRNERALCIFRGFAPGSVDKDYPNSHEVIFSKSARLPYIERIPPYRTWIFLDRNQRMADDQSVVGRRRIYYDESGSETLICSDSEDDLAELEEEKREFSEGEDRILWMAFQEHGFTEEVADIVSQFIGGTTTEIQERYNELKEKFQEECDKKDLERSVFMEKSLSAALDSFDNLFCRRCLVFDCRLHGCSQNLVFPSERQPNCSDLENNEKPCSDQCYLLATKSDEKLREDAAFGSGLQMANASLNGDNSSLTSFEEKASVDGAESMRNGGQENTPATLVATSTMPTSQHENSGKRKIKEQTSALKVDTDNSKHRKEMKISVIDSELNDKHSVDDLAVTTSKDPNCPADLSCHQTGVRGEDEDISEKFIKKKPTIMRGEASSSWKPLEKELFMKGLEIFGKNSCLISRNLLSGLKSCIEVSNYMHNGGPMVSHKSDAMPSSFTEENGKACLDMEQEIPSRSRLFRKRGRGRRLKYSSKSGGHPSSWKRIGDGKNHSCKQYTPCGCQFMCGKQCPCLNDGTCCEKYCGCSKSCKNRFRGCHCAKSQCRSRQCPCFAANRECDPDVCRNCWVSCGDGSLGEPPKRGDGQCGNMRLLLRQQQRILLARSDVAGWGAFIKNSVNKHDYLGEYTGELISHREADKRGKIYDRANSSFLFDLNDQYVLDACRNGDKLKFANHSSKPNCYCKIMLVAGDHRVGIFSKERIEPGEELFYDYRYGPDQAPAWARKPGGSKKDESFPPQVRARKHQSH